MVKEYPSGLVERDFVKTPFGSMTDIPMLKIKPIDRSLWPDMVAKKTAERSWLWDVMKDNNIDSENQSNLGWCHTAGLVGAATTLRVVRGLPIRRFSIASVAGPITGWKNKGMPILSALRQAMDHGIGLRPDSPGADASVCMPNLTLHKSDMTDAVVQEALKYRVVGYEIDASVFETIVTLALMDIPTIWGIYRDWGHCVWGSLKLVYIKGKLRVIYRNSWTDSFTDDTLDVNEYPGCGSVEEAGYRCPEECYALAVAA